MKTFYTILTAVLILSLSSCTAILIEEIDGGHSPMMILDGQWDIDSHTETTNGITQEVGNAERVWFNSTKDIGNYCEGTWLEAIQQVDQDFLWGINPQGSEFKLKDTGDDVKWSVIRIKKDLFIIERVENDVTERMEFTR